MSYRRGVNLCGAEFGAQFLPGVLGTNYTFNSEATFHYFASKGLTLLRIPILWERVQPLLGGDLDALYLDLMRQDIAWAMASGCDVIFELQNFGRYGGAVTNAEDLADVWVRLSLALRREDAVYGYDLMNEPHDLKPANWKAISQAVVTSVRASGDEKLILVPGDRWSSAAHWPKVHGRSAWIEDPAANIAYEAHLYFDSDFSGTYARSYEDELADNPDLATVGVDRFLPFANWCRNNGVRGYLGEYGIPGNDERWGVVLDGFLTALDAEGFDGTCWAAGEWWPESYPLSLQPTQDFQNDRPQLNVLLRHLPENPQAPNGAPG